MDESQKHYAKWKKADTKGYFMILFLWNSGEEKTVGLENRSITWGYWRSLQDDGNVLYLDCGGSCTTVNIYHNLENSALKLNEFSKFYLSKANYLKVRGTWMAQSVKHLGSGWVMISWFLSSSPISVSLLSEHSRLQILCLKIPSPTHVLSLENKHVKEFLKNKNKLKKTWHTTLFFFFF